MPILIDDEEAQAALSRQGRYHVVAGNLRVKEVVLDDGTMRDRFVICHNPDQADRDQIIRGQLLTQLGAAIADSHTLTATARAVLAGELRGLPGTETVPAGHSRRSPPRRSGRRAGRGPSRRQVPAPVNPRA